MAEIIIEKCPLCGAEIEKTTVVKEGNKILIGCKEEFKRKRWIPCSERLPEVYEKVLTYNDEGIIHDNFRLNLRDGSVGWSQGWGITHWRPRPEPPEKE